MPPDSQYPTTLDTATQIPILDYTVDREDTPGKEHDLLHNALQKAILALEAKVGANGSAVVTALDYLVRPRPNANKISGLASAAAGTPVVPQSTPGATNTIIYTVPAGTVSYVNRVVVTTLNSAVQTFRMAVNHNGGTNMAQSPLVAWDTPVALGETVELLQGAVLPPGATIVAYASNSQVDFTIFAVEVAQASLGETHLYQMQANPGATAALLYSVPSGKKAFISLLHVANVSSAGGPPYRYWVAVNANNSANMVAQYIWLPAGEAHAILQGVALPATTPIYVSADHQNITFNLFGTEVAA